MFKDKFIVLLANFISRLLDIQISKFTYHFLQFIVGTLGIINLLLILFNAMNQSITDGVFANTLIGTTMLAYSSTYLYQLCLIIVYPVLLIYGIIIAPVTLIFMKCYEPCEELKNHETDTKYEEEETLKRIVNNLLAEHYEISYGNFNDNCNVFADNDTNKTMHNVEVTNSNNFNDVFEYYDVKNNYYLDTYKLNKKMGLIKENIFIRVFVYQYESFSDTDIKDSIQIQINESLKVGKKHFCTNGASKKGFILPIFVFKNADKQTKKYIIKQYQKIGNIRLLPCLYNGDENWWYHRCKKRPLILVILKKLERSIDTNYIKEDFNTRYYENNYFVKGRGYSEYKAAVEYLENHKYKKALKYFLKAVKVNKYEHYKSHGFALIGICYDNLGQLLEAEQSYLTALQYDSKNYICLRCLAMLYTAATDYDQAISYFDNYLTVCPQDEIALLHYGALRMKLQQYDLAIELLQRADKEDPKNSECIEQLAAAYHANGDTKKSIIYTARLRNLD